MTTGLRHSFTQTFGGTQALAGRFFKKDNMYFSLSLIKVQDLANTWSLRCAESHMCAGMCAANRHPKENTTFS